MNTNFEISSEQLPFVKPDLGSQESSASFLAELDLQVLKNTKQTDKNDSLSYLRDSNKIVPNILPNLGFSREKSEAGDGQFVIFLPEESSKWNGKDKRHKETDTSRRKGEKETDPAKSLFGKNEKALEAISPEACVQPYGIGNCYFVAAMASFAKVNPQGIIDMVKANDDGSYTVKFPGASESVTVDHPTDAELDQVGGLSKYGVWPVVLMKAYGKYCGNTEGKMEGADGGSAFSAGVRVFSPKGVSYLGVGYMLPLMSWSSMDAELKAALKPENPRDAIPVTASTSKSPFSDTTVDGFVRSHVYSVLDYEHNSQNIKQSKVTVRNPHGGANAVKVITLEQFYNNFLQLSVAKR